MKPGNVGNGCKVYLYSPGLEAQIRIRVVGLRLAETRWRNCVFVEESLPSGSREIVILETGASGRVSAQGSSEREQTGPLLLEHSPK